MPLRPTSACIGGLAVSLSLGIVSCGEQQVSLDIAEPRDRQTVRASQVVVHGLVEPPGATVRVNDRPVPARGGMFAVTIRLHRGRNRINVAAASSGLKSDIQDLIVRRGRTRREIATARRREAARRATASRAEAPRNGGERYPEPIRESFLESCGQRTTLDCRCALDYLEDHASFSSLQRAEIEIFRNGEVPRVLTEAVAACR